LFSYWESSLNYACQNLILCHEYYLNLLGGFWKHFNVIFNHREF
jgi:hypothetical protein